MQTILSDPSCPAYAAWCITQHAPTDLTAVHESAVAAIPGHEGRELRVSLHADGDEPPALRVEAMYNAALPLAMHILDIAPANAVVLAVSVRILAEVSRVTVPS